MTNVSYLNTPVPVEFQYKSIIDCFNERAAEAPDKEILIHRYLKGGRKSLTCRELQQNSAKLAKYLVLKGINVGDKVAIIGPNTLEWAIGEFAMIMSGAVAVHMQKTSEDFNSTVELLKSSGCKAALIDTESDTSYLSKVEAYFVSEYGVQHRDERMLVVLIQNPYTGTDIPFITGILSTEEEEEISNTSLPRINPDSSSIVYLTSGSTGTPKMVEYTHFAVVNASLTSVETTLSDLSGIKYSDRPFAWLGGTILFDIITGNPRVFVETKISLKKENITNIWEIIMAEKCEVAFFLPFALNDLIQKKQELMDHGYKLRTISTGGQVVSNHYSELVNTLCERIICVYGSTEVGLVSAIQLTLETKVGEVGTLLPGYEVKIVGEDNETLDRDHMGEILIRSRFMMERYQNSPERNKASFIAGGWFKTGDIGIVATDDKLYVKGKAKDVIKRGGIKILSSEIENVMVGFEGVSDVYVFSVPDDRLLEEVCACFVFDNARETIEVDIRKLCTEKLGDNVLGKSPSHYFCFESFPQLPNGKPDKIRIKDRAFKMLNIH